jgi:thymidylate synthase
VKKIMNVQSIRELFRSIKPDPATGMLEIINASFIADEACIFGTVNQDYVERELDWCLSESLNVNDIPGDVPSIWKAIATPAGEINSNYGWCILSVENGSQFDSAISALESDINSRQAVMIYNRPSMHKDSKRDGMKDFMCTHSTHLMIRNGELHYIVNMRSNDAIFGYKNDFAWHDYVMDRALERLSCSYPQLTRGNIYWNAGSLHIYPCHHHLVV